jgi:hypothetical protein
VTLLDIPKEVSDSSTQEIQVHRGHQPGWRFR